MKTDSQTADDYRSTLEVFTTKIPCPKISCPIGHLAKPSSHDRSSLSATFASLNTTLREWKNISEYESIYSRNTSNRTSIDQTQLNSDSDSELENHVEEKPQIRKSLLFSIKFGQRNILAQILHLLDIDPGSAYHCAEMATIEVEKFLQSPDLVDKEFISKFRATHERTKNLSGEIFNKFSKQTPPVQRESFINKLRSECASMQVNI